MSAAVTFNDSQAASIEWLKNLPNAYAINVRVREQHFPNHDRVKPEVTIEGGFQPDPDRTRCESCESNLFYDGVHVTMTWRDGRFRESYIGLGGRRRHLKTIEGTKAVVAEEIERIELLREHKLMDHGQSIFEVRRHLGLVES